MEGTTWSTLKKKITKSKAHIACNLLKGNFVRRFKSVLSIYYGHYPTTLSLVIV